MTALAPDGPAGVLGSPPPELVAFDLDGTLVDSAPDLAWCIDRTMVRFGIPARGVALVRTWVGDGAERLVERAITGELDAPADPELLEEACAVFLNLYASHGRERTRVYAGVRDGLAALRSRGAALACITNKPHSPAVGLLAHLEMLDWFDLVLGGDSLARRKPDPLPLVHACAELGVPVERAVFAGDSINDVQAARAAGMRVACVSYGYDLGVDIRQTGPDAVVDSLVELADLCSGAPAPRCAAGP